ncbi:MAG: ABC transporter permease [Acidobacteriota bacterium]|nr:ABC transporter permease [Acidobacteriota bacterium]
MLRFAGILRHELNMSIRRRGLWIAYGMLFLFYTVVLFSPPPLGEMIKGEVLSRSQMWPVAGRFLAAVNVFFPVVAGIVSADRLQRDFRLGLRELQESTPLSRPAYVLAKYLGALASSLLPLFLWVMLITAVMSADGHAPIGFLYAVPVAFLAITVPAFAFVVAFSLACPTVMPLSIYQILFTGYWFWANFIPPRLFPTLNGTLLTPSGVYALQGFFGGRVSQALEGPLRYTAHDAILNLSVLGACIAAVLLLLERRLGRQARRA